MFNQLNSVLIYIYWKFPQGMLGAVPLMCCSSLGSCCICQSPSPRPSPPTPLPWTRSPPRNRRLLRSFRLIINESWLVKFRTKYWVSSIPTVQTMPWQSDPNWNSRAIWKMMMFVDFLECYRSSRYITDDLSMLWPSWHFISTQDTLYKGLNIFPNLWGITFNFF